MTVVVLSVVSSCAAVTGLAYAVGDLLGVLYVSKELARNFLISNFRL